MSLSLPMYCEIVQLLDPLLTRPHRPHNRVILHCLLPALLALERGCTLHGGNPCRDSTFHIFLRRVEQRQYLVIVCQDTCTLLDSRRWRIDHLAQRIQSLVWHSKIGMRQAVIIRQSCRAMINEASRSRLVLSVYVEMLVGQ